MFATKSFQSKILIRLLSRDSLVSNFERILNSKNVLTDPQDTSSFNVDWKGQYRTAPSKGHDNSVVLFPRSHSHVQEVIKFCHEKRIKVCPQGGNTGLVGGSVPVHADEVIINFSRMNKILSIDEDSSVVTCEAGCVLQELDHKLNAAGLCAPLDLGAKGSCQIGGNVSTNAGGVRFIKYGSLRENVLGLKAVLADGSELDLSKSVRKDNTGLGLKQLMIGSEGTLALITEINLLCPPLPTSRSVILLGIPNFESVLKVLRHAKIRLSGCLAAFELIDKESMAIVVDVMKYKPPFELKDDFYVLVEVSGSGREERAVESFVSLILENKLASNGIAAADEKQCENIWALRENLTASLLKKGANYKFDVSLPMKNYYQLVEFIRHKWDSSVKHVVAFGHVGDGNLHLNVVDFEYNQDRCQSITEDVFGYTLECNGSISAEHGIGREKLKFLKSAHRPEYIEYMRRTKHLFDPFNLLNPGKFYN